MRSKGRKTRRFNNYLTFFLVFLCLSASLRFTADAQVRPVYDYGAIGLAQLLKRLNTTASVMMIGAHPDDEDSALLAYLARGENARTAYLSLTRGDGGQNIIGPELFESLGVIRTEELLQARRLDGSEQYFTRAYDYGFSKTLAEAKEKWPEEIIKCDVVRAIRTFRPLVVIARFSGTPADGHGQHQYAGFITPLAVKAAADQQRCTQSGTPWQVLKFYVEQGFGDNLPAPTLRVDTGAYDPLLGRSYFEIAMEGRSQHRSQGEGRIEFHGEQFSGLNLVFTNGNKVESEKSIFDGIDTTIKAIPKTYKTRARRPAGHYLSISEAAAKSLSEFDPKDPSKILGTLIDGYASVNLALEYDPGIEVLPSGEEIYLIDYHVDHILALERGLFKDAIQKVIGLQIDAFADKETVVAGEGFFTAVKVFAANNEVKVKEIKLKARNGWTFAATVEPKDNNAAFNRRQIANKGAYFNVQVAQNAELTQPYWLKAERDGGLYRWPNDDNQNLPFQPPLVTAEVKIEINGTIVTFNQTVQYRFADAARGELRRELNVVPALSIGVDNVLLIVPYSDKPQTRSLTVTATNNSSLPVKGIAGLNITAATEWKVSATSREVLLKTRGEKASVAFEVTIPAKTNPGNYYIYPSVAVGESLASQTMNTIAYPHIQTHRFYARAETKVNVLDLKVAPVKVGYIMGSGDDVPEAIMQMGLNVMMLDEKTLASGDLSNFDTIVVGIRASETRPELLANNARLLNFVKNGGNMIVQYQRGNWTSLAPLPVNTQDRQGTTAGSISRVVDENATVTILQPNHPVFNFPNKITAADFKGWVQERNAYNLVTFDPQYTPLLESHDAGEAENKGGLVIARVGKGNYVYCSYSMFRQLPAGVPGAYRLFANILSLPKSLKK